MPNPKDDALGSESFLEEQKQLKSFGLHLELTRQQFVRTAGTITAAVAAGLPTISLAESVDTPSSHAVTLQVMASRSR